MWLVRMAAWVFVMLKYMSDWRWLWIAAITLGTSQPNSSANKTEGDHGRGRGVKAEIENVLAP